MNKLFYIFCLLVLASCTSNTIYKKPRNLIPKDTMVMLLTDMYVATSAKYVKNKFLQRDIDYTALVYEKYKIDSVRFEQSNFYYNSKIELYNEILKKVKKELELNKNVYKLGVKFEKFINKTKNQSKTVEKDTFFSLQREQLDILQ